MKFNKELLRKAAIEVGRILTAAVIATGLVIKALDMLDQSQQEAPAPVSVLVSARPTPGAATATARTRETPTASAATATPAASATPGAATATPSSGACPAHVNAWHAPQNEPCLRHHHGVNPRLYASVFDTSEFSLDTWLDTNGELWQTWSPPEENKLGYIWLYVHADTCELFNNGGELPVASFGCVTDVLFRTHDVGTAAHIVTRFHSHAFIVRACNQLASGTPGDTCGTLAAGELVDYGILEAPYKTEYCQISDLDPSGFHSLDQSPYRAIQTQLRSGIDLVSFWSGLNPNAVNDPYYPGDPNALVGVVWNSTDTFQVWDFATGCGKASSEVRSAASAMPFTGLDHSNFNLFTVMIPSIPGAPFVGFNDASGHIVSSCAGVDPCIPLVITSGFPSSALYNRKVDNTIPGALEFFDPNVPFLPPWLDTP